MWRAVSGSASRCCAEKAMRSPWSLRRWSIMRGEYLLEVRSEEIPARMLEPGVRELATRLFEELMARGLGPREIETGHTPRRLVLCLSGLPLREPDRAEQVLGPPVRAAFAADGSPTP